jgi:hypothetical protein
VLKLASLDKLCCFEEVIGIPFLLQNSSKCVLAIKIIFSVAFASIMLLVSPNLNSPEMLYLLSEPVVKGEFLINILTGLKTFNNCLRFQIAALLLGSSIKPKILGETATIALSIQYML